MEKKVYFRPKISKKEAAQVKQIKHTAKCSGGTTHISPILVEDEQK